MTIEERAREILAEEYRKENLDLVTSELSKESYRAQQTKAALAALRRALQDDALRWPIQAEGIGVILIESLNIPEIATKIAKAIQSGKY